MSRLAEIFDEALDLSDSRRAGFLDRACGADSDLRAEVESLLSYHRGDTVTDVSEGGKDATRGPGTPVQRGLATRRSRRRLAIVCALASAVVLATGALAHRVVLDQLQRETTARLEASLDAGVTGYHDWIGEWRGRFEELAGQERVGAAVRELVTLTQGLEIDPVTASRLEPHRELEGVFATLNAREDVININVLNRESLVVFFADASLERRVYRLSPQGAQITAPVFSGETVVTPPHATGANVAGGNTADGVSQVGLCVPVYGEEGVVVANLTLRVRAEPAVTERMRAAGDDEIDVYAFDPRGLMVSRPRRESVLYETGRLQEDRIASLNVSVRDPGVALDESAAPPDPPEVWPQTRMVRQALGGRPGVDLEGYPDYTGRPVLGAWTWLPEYGIGIASEIGRDDAYGSLVWLRRGFGAMAILLALVAAGAGLSARRRRTAPDRVVVGEQLGQYRLERTIGTGGMARVYRARHERLPRPMALKVLEGDVAEPDARARFEREVRLVSRLRHPNTVQVFDYGQDTRGRLFYVMELVPGLNLGELVKAAGALPAGRTVRILTQICASLREAHGLGIVHRDIKPANVMVSERAGQVDVVTVLDFGLARTTAQGATQLTGQHVLGGTPAYIAPERIEKPSRVDARSDVYSIGAVGYYLLTGQDVVEGPTPHEVLLQAMHEAREPPSRRAPEPVPGALDDLIVRCLRRDPDHRPGDAAALAVALEALAPACQWNEQASRRWWDDHRSVAPEGGAP